MRSVILISERESVLRQKVEKDRLTLNNDIGDTGEREADAFTGPSVGMLKLTKTSGEEAYSPALLP